MTNEERLREIVEGLEAMGKRDEAIERLTAMYQAVPRLLLGTMTEKEGLELCRSMRKLTKIIKAIDKRKLQ